MTKAGPSKTTRIAGKIKNTRGRQILFSIIIFFVKDKKEKNEGFAPGHWYAGAFLLLGAILASNVLGFTPIKIANVNTGNPYSTFFLILGYIFNAYGVVLYLSSVVVGFFIARAAKILSTDQSISS